MCIRDSLYTVYIAYEPDIILLNQEEEIFESSKASDIDMYICLLYTSSGTDIIKDGNS